MCGGHGAATRGAGGATQGPAHGEAPPVQAPPSPAPNVGKCERTNQPNSWRFVEQIWRFVEKMARAGVDISDDSVSVITSVLTIRNIDPSCIQNLRLKKMAWAGVDISDSQSTGNYRHRIARNIDPSSGHFFKANSRSKFGVEFKQICCPRCSHLGTSRAWRSWSSIYFTPGTLRSHMHSCQFSTYDW